MSSWIKDPTGTWLKGSASYVPTRILPRYSPDLKSNQAILISELSVARADLACAERELNELRTAYARLIAMPDDAPKRDHIGPDDAPHRRVHDVIGDLTAGRVTEPARKGLRDALDKADAPPPKRLPDGTHRAPSGKAFSGLVGRAGLWVP